MICGVARQNLYLDVLKHRVKSKLKWLLLLSTPWKFNISPENKPSQRKVIFQPSFFRGELLNFWGVTEVPSNFRENVFVNSFIRDVFFHVVEGFFAPRLSKPTLHERNLSLGGGSKYFLCSSLPGELIQFDVHIFQMG